MRSPQGLPLGPPLSPTRALLSAPQACSSQRTRGPNTPSSAFCARASSSEVGPPASCQKQRGKAPPAWRRPAYPFQPHPLAPSTTLRVRVGQQWLAQWYVPWAQAPEYIGPGFNSHFRWCSGAWGVAKPAAPCGAQALWLKRSEIIDFPAGHRQRRLSNRRLSLPKGGPGCEGVMHHHTTDVSG